jgi:protein-disulfide isomerase
MTSLIRFLVGLIFVCATFEAGNISAQSLSPSLSSGQVQEVEGIISNYLRKNPQIIVEAIEALRSREIHNEDTRRKHNLLKARQKILHDEGSPVGGNQNGDVTVVEFFDYRCSFCKKVFSFIPTLLKQDPNLRFVFKELPILSPESEMAARAALVVWKFQKKKYFPFHKALMESRGNLSELHILSIAENKGLTQPVFERKCTPLKSTKCYREIMNWHEF